MGVVRSKVRSLGQILEKPCEHSRGFNFDPISFILGQNYCLDKISDKVENGCGWI